MQKNPSATRAEPGLRWGWLILAILIAMGIVGLTMLPGDRPQRNPVNLIPFAVHGPALGCLIFTCNNFRFALWMIIIDVVGNILVFVPFGFCLTAALRAFLKQKHTMEKIVLTGFGLSLGIELAQLAIPSRATDIDDLIFNTIGTMLGLSLWLVFALATRKREELDV